MNNYTMLMSQRYACWYNECMLFLRIHICLVFIIRASIGLFLLISVADDTFFIQTKKLLCDYNIHVCMIHVDMYVWCGLYVALEYSIPFLIKITSLHISHNCCKINILIHCNLNSFHYIIYYNCYFVLASYSLVTIEMMKVVLSWS